MDKNYDIKKFIRLLDYLDAGYTGKGKTIVVIDDLSFPNKYQNIEMPFPNQTNNLIQHRTQVCSCIRELLPDVRIVALNKSKYKTECIEYIEAHQKEIDVINCSFDSPRDSDKEFWDRLGKLNIPVVCSSGNYSSVWSGGVCYPADLDYTIAVGAYNMELDEVPKYSNGGSDLDCVAPTNVWIKNSKGKYILFEGTSSSTPVVSCILIIYSMVRDKIKLSKLTSDMAKRFIKRNSKDILSNGKDFASGFGVLRLPSIGEINFHSTYGNSQYFDENLW